jgi:hypothetical protein
VSARVRAGALLNASATPTTPPRDRIGGAHLRRGTSRGHRKSTHDPTAAYARQILSLASGAPARLDGVDFTNSRRR